jgi:hypothetical protein
MRHWNMPVALETLKRLAVIKLRYRGLGLLADVAAHDSPPPCGMAAWSVALRTNPAPRMLRIIGASFGPSTLRRSFPK